MIRKGKSFADQKTLARFEASFERRGSNQCWPWLKCCDGWNYGTFYFQGKNRKAHRVAFYLKHGRWPEPNGLHSCDNPPCCNPRHVFEGTDADNAADRVAKGRQAKGEILAAPKRGDLNGSRRHPESVPRGDRHYARLRPERLPRGESHGNAKLTVAKVAKIWRWSKKFTGKEIAARLKVSSVTVYDVLNFRTWRHVSTLPKVGPS